MTRFTVRRSGLKLWFGILAAGGTISGLVGFCIVLINIPHLTAPSVNLDLSRVPDLEHGQKIYAISCASCHGPSGKGLPHQGAPLDRSIFLANSTDLQIIQMIKLGRTANDPKSVMRLPMPAKGGYSHLSDTDLHDVTAYIRTFGQKISKVASESVSSNQGS